MRDSIPRIVPVPHTRHRDLAKGVMTSYRSSLFHGEEYYDREIFCVFITMAFSQVKFLECSLALRSLALNSNCNHDVFNTSILV